VTRQTAEKSSLPSLGFLFFTGILGWWVPGAGHWIVGRHKHAVIIFISLTFAFSLGIYIGSIAAIDARTPWYWAQLLYSPAAAYIAHLSGSVYHLDSYGRPREIGEIYTGVAGMLNLLCVINAVYLAHCINVKEQNQ
jgi:hypothetical protein